MSSITGTGLGITIMGGDVATCARIAARAEAAGFSSAWTAEFYDRSATVSLAAMATATSRIRLGSAIVYAFGRSPLLTVTESRDLDELSGGRLVLGLGTGTRHQVSGWLGLDPDHLAPRIEELVPLLRRLWRDRNQAVHHECRFYRMRLDPIVDVRPPRREDLPIYVAAVNPRMAEAAGRVADGLVGHPLFTARYVEEVVRPALARGARRAGREGTVPIAAYVLCAVGDDVDEARRAVANQIAFYAVVRSFDAILKLHGFDPEVAAIREAFRRGDTAGAAAAVSDRMIETIAIVGRPEEARQQFLERFAGRYEEPLLFCPCVGVETGRLREGMEAMIEAFTPLAGDGRVAAAAPAGLGEAGP